MTCDARAVDQQVDAAPALEDLRRRRLHAGAVGHVARGDQGAVVAAELARERPQALPAPGDQRYPCPARREVAGELGADAARRPGDERHAIAKVGETRHGGSGVRLEARPRDPVRRIPGMRLHEDAAETRRVLIAPDPQPPHARRAPS